MYINRGVYLFNTILVMEIFCYQYSTNYNSAKKQYFSIKFGSCFRIFWGIKCTKLFFRFIWI